MACVVLICLGLPALAGAAPPDQALLLDVVLNGNRTGKVGEFQLRAGALSATRRELDELGLAVEPGPPLDLIPLETLPGVGYRFDGPSQSVFLTATNQARRPDLLRPTDDGAPVPFTESALAAVLNYDIVGTMQGGRSRLDGLFDTRAVSRLGVVDSAFLGRAGAGVDRMSTVRLGSTYTNADPDTLRRVRVGDVVSSGLAWTRPVRLGGAQYARAFALRPDLVTFPVPAIAGQVAVPSTVDVVVNGVQQFSSNASPGPFEIRQLPIVTGTNDISLVVNNAIGQQVTRTLNVYASTALLAKGLDEYSVEAGPVRVNYGILSNDYRDVAGVASYRRGLTDSLTVTAHAEGTGNLGMGGAGLATSLGGVGAASVALAASTAGRRRALLGYASFERITRQVSVSASVQLTEPGFSDVATQLGDVVPRSQVRASVGVSLRGGGSVGVAYMRQRRTLSLGFANGTPANSLLGVSGGRIETLLPLSFALPQRVSLLSASYTTPVFGGRASFYATAFHDFESTSRSGALFGLTIPLGTRNTVSALAGTSAGDPSGTLQASRSVVAIGDTGGQAVLSAGRPSRQLAVGNYKSPWALLEAGVDRVEGQSAYRASATGAVVLAGGGLFASNSITDSFAVVDTGTAGIPVLSENRLVGRTGQAGQLLVPDLRSFEVNRLSIDPADAPLDADFGQTARQVRPQDRAGLVVSFPVRRGRSAQLRIVDEAGANLPVGARVQLLNDDGRVGEETVLGFDGLVYLREVADRQRVIVSATGRAPCLVMFEYRKVDQTIPIIGPLRCRPVAR